MGWRAPALALGLGAVASGCYPGSLDESDDATIVATVRDTTRDFTLLGTFAMPNRVFDLPSLEGLPIERDETHDDRILDDFARGMADLGWQRIGDPMSPDVDLVLLVGAVATNNFIWVGTPGWGYYPGWGYIYPPNWSSVNVPEGTVIGILVRPSEYDPVSQGVPVAWAAIVQGVLRGDAHHVAQRLDAGIAKAFDQSPYLRIGDAVPVDATAGGFVGDAGTDGGVE